MDLPISILEIYQKQGPNLGAFFMEQHGVLPHQIAGIYHGAVGKVKNGSIFEL